MRPGLVELQDHIQALKARQIGPALVDEYSVRHAAPACLKNTGQRSSRGVRGDPHAALDTWSPPKNDKESCSVETRPVLPLTYGNKY